MTELQYLTALSNLRSEVGLLGSNFFTIWTAYMIAVYLVGDKLSMTFSVLVTVIYSTFLAGTATTLMTAIDTAYYIGANYRLSYPDTLVAPVSRYIEYVSLVTLLVSWLISILFFLQQRKVVNWK